MGFDRYLDDFAKDDFKMLLGKQGIAAAEIEKIQAGGHRDVAVLKNGHVVHYSNNKNVSGYRDPLPLEAEGQALNVISEHMAKHGIAMPRVLKNWKCENGGIFQLRTKVDGESYEDAIKRPDFDHKKFAISLGHVVAALHSCPLDKLHGLIPQSDPLQRGQTELNKYEKRDLRKKFGALVASEILNLAEASKDSDPEHTALLSALVALARL